MIDGDSSEYELLEKWSKGFDCQGYKSCEIGVNKGYGSKVIWTISLIIISMWVLIHMVI